MKKVPVVLQGEFTESPDHIVSLVKLIEGGADIVAGSLSEDESPKAKGMKLARWAASTFLQAAQELEAGIQIFEELLPEEKEQELMSELAEMVEEAASCSLHVALCHLKQQEYARCIQSCTDVLCICKS